MVSFNVYVAVREQTYERDEKNVGGITKDSIALLERIASAVDTAEATRLSASISNTSGKRTREDFEGQTDTTPAAVTPLPICSQLRIMPPQKLLPPGVKRQFRYNHAKYVVADGERSLISSENFSLNGHPDAGLKGTRGWDIVLDDAELAQTLTQLFVGDSNLARGDVQVFGRALSSKLKEKWNTPEAPAQEGAQSHDAPAEAAANFAAPARSGDWIRRVPAYPMGSGAVEKATLITSPNSAPALRKVIEESQKRIDLNFMSLPKDSPILGSLVEAARRGVTTRLLLNDMKLFSNSGKSRPTSAVLTANSSSSASNAASGSLGAAPPPAARRPSMPKRDPQVETAKFARRLAACEKIPIDARIIDAQPIEITYIHNKGIILDTEKVLISSINGTQNSMDNNREVAVLVNSTAAAQYYGQLFDSDWDQSPVIDISRDLALFPCAGTSVLPSEVPAGSILGFLTGVITGK